MSPQDKVTITDKGIRYLDGKDPILSKAQVPQEDRLILSILENRFDRSHHPHFFTGKVPNTTVCFQRLHASGFIEISEEYLTDSEIFQKSKLNELIRERNGCDFDHETLLPEAVCSDKDNNDYSDVTCPKCGISISPVNNLPISKNITITYE